MTRPRRNDHLREILLNKGIECITEHGYHGTGLKQILDAVGVPKGSFYHYFASKEKFVAEVIEWYNLKSMVLLDSYISTSPEDPLTIVRNVLIYMIQVLEHDPKGCLVGNIAAEIGDESPDCQAAMQAAINEWSRRISGLMEQAQAQDLVRNDIAPQVMADMMWNAWQGGLLRMKIDGTVKPLEQTLEVMLGVLFSSPNLTQ